MTANNFFGYALTPKDPITGKAGIAELRTSAIGNEIVLTATPRPGLTIETAMPSYIISANGGGEIRDIMKKCAVASLQPVGPRRELAYALARQTQLTLDLRPSALANG